MTLSKSSELSTDSKIVRTGGFVQKWTHCSYTRLFVLLLPFALLHRTLCTLSIMSTTCRETTLVDCNPLMHVTEDRFALIDPTSIVNY